MRGSGVAALFWLVVASFHSVLSSGAALQWTIYPIAQEGTNAPVRLFDVAFGNDRFVGIENSGGIYSAPGSEPTVWTRRTSIEDFELIRIKFANGRFLVVGHIYRVGDGFSKGCLLSSTDGMTWTRKEFESASDVAYGNGWYVVVGDEMVARSTNALDWEIKTNFVSNSLHLFRQVSFVNGEFIATFLAGGIFPMPYMPQKLGASKDGEDWEEHSLQGESYSEIAYGRRKYVSLGLTDYGPAGWPYDSDDGRGWREGKYPVNFDGYAVEYANGVFAVVGWDGRSAVSTFMSSTNGVTWEAFEVAPGKPFRGLTFGRGRFVAVGYGYEGGSGVVAVSELVGPVRRISNLNVTAEVIAFDVNAEEKTEWEVEVSEDLVTWRVVQEIEGGMAGVERVNVARGGDVVRFVRLKEKR